MPDPLPDALATLRPLLLGQTLVRAVAAGRRRHLTPSHTRAEVRPVELKGGPHLHVVLSDALGPHATNHAPGVEASAAVDALLAEPFGNWHVETTDRTVQLRVTKKGEAQVHVAIHETPRRGGATTTHDRPKQHLIDPADPLFDVLGADGAKRRQVDAFLRLLAPPARAVLARAAGEDRPLQVVDLGCGNAYLTFAAHRYLSALAAEGEAAPSTPQARVRTVGIDVRPEMAQRNTDLAQRLGMTDLHFVAGAIAEVEAEAGTGPTRDGVDLALALHACDTATDDALAWAVRERAGVILAAPCCHHDLQRQITEHATSVPHPYAALTRHGILKERFADVLTDALRADLLRILGYRVDVVEFIDSTHTPRNAMIRAVRSEATATPRRIAEYLDLVDQWQVSPALASRLSDELADRLN